VIQGNELVTCILGVGVVVFVWANRSALREVPGVRLLLGAFVASFAAWAATNLEALLWYEWLNLTEHLCYLMSISMLGLWCWVYVCRGETRR